jgi:hypothetical protein
MVIDKQPAKESALCWVIAKKKGLQMVTSEYGCGCGEGKEEGS